MLLRLDEDTNRLLIKAKDRSSRSKTAEAYMRLRDHLERFPDFYNSETVEGKKHNKTFLKSMDCSKQVMSDI
ncbi:TraY domain-containing protein [Enterobacter roggenkampii]|uniref:TraY domain-containing protein n=1 Tax=Enterobacter roggenkampii TaxID=1812935 RepID=UPI003BC83102